MVSRYQQWCIQQNKKRLAALKQKVKLGALAMAKSQKAKEDNPLDQRVGKWASECPYLQSLKEEHRKHVVEGVKAFNTRIVPRLMFQFSLSKCVY